MYEMFLTSKIIKYRPRIYKKNHLLYIFMIVLFIARKRLPYDMKLDFSQSCARNHLCKRNTKEHLLFEMQNFSKNNIK